MAQVPTATSASVLASMKVFTPASPSTKMLFGNSAEVWLSGSTKIPASMATSSFLKSFIIGLK